MKKTLKRLLLMIQFFTQIPIPWAIPCESKDYGKGLALGPIIGLMMGGILYGAFLLFSLILPPFLTAIFVVLVYTVLTGGLHIDGLADTLDGLFSHRDIQRKLEIMKDSRVGTHGMVGVLFLMFFYVGLILVIEPIGLVFMPVVGKVGALVCASRSTYARDQGLGEHFINHCNLKELIIGILLMFPIAYILLDIKGLIIALIMLVCSAVLSWLLTKPIKGATGDVLGAMNELTQIIYLLVLYWMVI